MNFNPATPTGLAAILAPELLLTGWAIIVLMFLSWRHSTDSDARAAGWLSLPGIAITAAVVVWFWVSGAEVNGVPQMVALDTFRLVSDLIFLVVAAATVLISLAYLPREGMRAPEYYCLILLATVGMMLMAGAADLIILFLGLEIMSVAVYVLAGFRRDDAFSSEAALKYFLIGAFASGFLLYGIALVYGATGTTNLVLIGAALTSAGMSLMSSIGLGMLLIGFGFKVAAAPFHMWAPDVYDGSPTPVTGLMATGVKAAAFVALMRVLGEAFPGAMDRWQPVIGILAMVTMILGNLVALAQRPLKRMLAYSSVAHAGYLLVAVWPGTYLGTSALMLYLVAYSLTTLAAFAILAWLGRDGEREVTLDDLAGLGRERPWMAFGLAISMLSLLGFPGTLGFIGKWYILSAVVVEDQYILAITLVVTSVISAGYYLPVVMASYMRPVHDPEAFLGVRLPSMAVVVVATCVVLLLVFGVWPSWMLDLAGMGAASLRGTLLFAP
ncbi:MAG: NADH-quinone oxidoreductase subunit N [Gemmatimonadales bacterium]